MRRVTRRDFVKGSIVAGVAFGVPSLGRTGTSLAPGAGPNSEVRLAIMGMGGIDTPGNVGGRGRQLIAMLQKVPGAKIVALCDVDQSLLRREAEALQKQGTTVATYGDIRKVLDEKNVDAVVVATPNHWHALATVWACQAGKDVFVEKPLAHSIWEGRQIVTAARKYGRIVQVDTEGRSSTALQQAFEFVRSGQIGPIRYAQVVLYRERKSIGKVTAPTPIPSTVDYNLWCGPAPVLPLMRKYLHYDWHWTWAYGSGEMGNNGVHYIDLCRWAMGENKPPRKAMSAGGRFGYAGGDDGQTPNTHVALLDFESAPVICEIHGLPEKRKGGFRGVERGIVLQCEGGHFAGNFEGGKVFDKHGAQVKEFKGPNFSHIQLAHVANFVETVRSRRSADLRAAALQGHLSTACCHMANISYRLGVQSAPEAILERTRANHELGESFERCQEHLRLNGVDLSATRGVLGPWVTLDAQTERFVGDFAGQANALATREYREPFVFPTAG